MYELTASVARPRQHGDLARTTANWFRLVTSSDPPAAKHHTHIRTYSWGNLRISIDARFQSKMPGGQADHLRWCHSRHSLDTCAVPYVGSLSVLRNIINMLTNLDSYWTSVYRQSVWELVIFWTSGIWDKHCKTLFFFGSIQIFVQNFIATETLNS